VGSSMSKKIERKIALARKELKLIYRHEFMRYKANKKRPSPIKKYRIELAKRAYELVYYTDEAGLFKPFKKYCRLNLPDARQSENVSPFNLAIRILAEHGGSKEFGCLKSSTLERWSKGLCYLYINGALHEKVEADLWKLGVTKLSDAYLGKEPNSRSGLVKRCKKRRRRDFEFELESFLARWRAA